MRRLDLDMPVRLFLTALIAAAIALAQEAERAPVIGPFGVLHGASQQPVRFSSDFISPLGIAPGSIFVLKGAYLGPDEIAVGAAPFGLRLPDEPGGAEIHVRSLETGEVAQARMVHAWAFQVAGILPEGFPLGEAEAQVFYRGRASEPAAFPVVRSYPGLYTLSQTGSGRGVIQNYESAAELPLNGLTRSTRPGQYVILWGTGLGEARTDEIQVAIGGRLHPLEYAGPAPGLPGVDQFNFRVPEDLTAFGCYETLNLVQGEPPGYQLRPEQRRQHRHRS